MIKIKQDVTGGLVEKFIKAVSSGLLTILLMVPGAKAITIEYTALNQGSGAWQYSYYLSGNTFNQYQGFQIYFDFNLYSNLDVFPSAPNADWGLVTYNPSALFSINGVYDAIALVNNPSLTDPFVISFDWSGVGQPSAQDFALYACEDVLCSTGVTFGQAGTTVVKNSGGGSNPNPIPEPFTLILIALGLLGIVFVRRRLCHT